MPATPGAMWWM